MHANAFRGACEHHRAGISKGDLTRNYQTYLETWEMLEILSKKEDIK
jgi:hypothetical protein